MRTYSGLLIFEDIFETISQLNPDIVNLTNTIFNPNLLIVENDCGTTLGKYEDLTFEVEGLTELATGALISRDRIIQLLRAGVYQVYTRHISTCISKGGVCKTCYSDTYRDQAVPNVLDHVTVLPEYLMGAQVITTEIGVTTYDLSLDKSQYDKTFAYVNGVLLTYGVDYTTAGTTLTLLTTPVGITYINLRMVRQDRVPFLVWLSHTYAGSVFGMQPLPSQGLPVRSLLISSLISDNMLQSVSTFIKGFQQIPSDYSNYIDSIKDPLEKALYLLALYSIYNNVTS